MRSLYRKKIMSIAWLVRTRPNIAAAVAHKQTNCSAPRDIDNRDLAYIIGFIANNLNAGMVIDCRDRFECTFTWMWVTQLMRTGRVIRAGLLSLCENWESTEYHLCGSPSSKRLQQSNLPLQSSSECPICSTFFSALMS